jgi:hypothetical protein
MSGWINTDMEELEEAGRNRTSAGSEAYVHVLAGTKHRKEVGQRTFARDAEKAAALTGSRLRRRGWGIGWRRGAMRGGGEARSNPADGMALLPHGSLQSIGLVTAAGGMRWGSFLCL